MGIKTMNSNSITFIDTTDSRTLIVRLTSNYPSVQIYDPNINAYDPAWTDANKLIITPSIYVDSAQVNVSQADSVSWQRKDGSDSNLVALSYTMSHGQQVDTGSKALKVSQNVLSNSPIITYICTVTYDGLTSSAEICFVRSDTGKDGRSLTVKGTASSVTAVSGTNYFKVKNGNDHITNAVIGDAWLYNGDLYVCSSLNQDGNIDYFYNAGHIQGPKGDSAKLISLTATSQVFKVNQIGGISPSTINIAGKATNTTISSWQYSTDGGHSFGTTPPGGVSRSGNIVTVTGSIFNSESLVVRAGDGTNNCATTIYKAFDGVDGQRGQTGDPAPTMFLTSNNIIFNSYSDNRLYPMSISVNIVAYVGWNKIMPQVDGNIIGVPIETPCSISEVGREKVLTFNIDSNQFLSGNTGSIIIPVKLVDYTIADTFDENEVYYSDIYGTALSEQPDISTFNEGSFYKAMNLTKATTNLKLFWHKIKQATVISLDETGSIDSIIDAKITEKLDSIAEELSRI